MIVTLKVTLELGIGDERRRFKLTSHAYCDPFEDSDPAWMVPPPETQGPSAQIATTRLAVELGQKLADMIGYAGAAAETPPAEDSEAPPPEWNDTGAPRRIPGAP